MMIPGDDHLRNVVIPVVSKVFRGALVFNSFRRFSKERLNQKFGGWGCMVFNLLIFSWLYKDY